MYRDLRPERLTEARLAWAGCCLSKLEKDRDDFREAVEDYLTKFNMELKEEQKQDRKSDLKELLDKVMDHVDAINDKMYEIKSHLPVSEC